MLLIVVVAFIATIGFYRQAQKLGLSPSKAARAPFLAAGILFVFQHIVARLVLRLGEYYQTQPFALHVVLILLNIFTLLIYLISIQYFWRIIRQPGSDRGSIKNSASKG